MSICHKRPRRTTILPAASVAAVAIVLASSTAAAHAATDTANTGWNPERAPTANQASAYLAFNFKDGDTTSNWRGSLRISGEVTPVPDFDRFSVFMRWGYLLFDDFTDTSGLEDWWLGVKIAIIDDPVFIFSSGVSVSVPFNTGGSLQDYVLGSIYAMGSLYFRNDPDIATGLNGTFRFGNLFALNDADTQFNLMIMIEWFLNIAPQWSLKVGCWVEGIASTENSSGYVGGHLYAEAQVKFDVVAPFIRIAAGWSWDESRIFQLTPYLLGSDTVITGGISAMF